VKYFLQKGVKKMKNTVLLLTVFLCFAAVNGFCSGNKEELKEIREDIDRLEGSLKLDQEQVALLQSLVDSFAEEPPDAETLSLINDRLSQLQGRVGSLENALKMLQDQVGIRQLDDKEPVAKSNKIMDNGSLRLEPVAAFIHSKNPDEKIEEIVALLNIYKVVSNREKVNYDIAIAQMCYATNYLKWGKNSHNYAGFSPEDTGRSSISFKNMEEGVLAHIQHLKAYASPDAIPRNQLVDPRHGILEKLGYLNSVETLDQLYAKWAGTKNEALYGRAITEILGELYGTSDNR
jgi:hypothetical protein